MIDAAEYTKHLLQRYGPEESRDFADDIEDCDISEDEDIDAADDAFQRGYFAVCDDPDHRHGKDRLSDERRTLPYDEAWLRKVLDPKP